MLNVYDGTLGVFLDSDKLATELNRYLAKTNEPLNYEVKEYDAKVVIITGKNDDEKDITLFQHPFIFKTIKGEDAIAMDLRAFMKTKIEDIITVREGMSDRYNGMLQLQRLVFTNMMFNESNIEWLSYSRQQLIEAFGSIISTITSMMVFDRSITESVDIVAKLHLISLDSGDDLSLEEYIGRLSRKNISDLTHGNLKDLYGMLNLLANKGDLVLPSRTLGSLVNNIKAIDSTGRCEGLTTDLYMQTLSRGFYSLDSKNLSVAMVEHLPTFISILINVITEGINNKSSFRKIIDGNKRNIKGKELAIQLKEVFENELI